LFRIASVPRYLSRDPHILFPGILDDDNILGAEVVERVLDDCDHQHRHDDEKDVNQVDDGKDRVVRIGVFEEARRCSAEKSARLFRRLRPALHGRAV
jgi:hypothetical protein